MARDFEINGPCMVAVKGPANTPIASLVTLGLTDKNPIRVSLNFKHDPIELNSWGDLPVEVQSMLVDLTVTMNLVHFDQTLVNICQQCAMGVIAPADAKEGLLPIAGARLGGGYAMFNQFNNLISLNLTAPVNNRPWQFLYTYLVNSVPYTLGVERNIVQLTWRAIGYNVDPYNAGSFSQGYQLWSHTLQS